MTTNPTPATMTLSDRVKQALREAKDSDATPKCEMDVALYLKTLNNGPRA